MNLGHSLEYFVHLKSVRFVKNVHAGVELWQLWLFASDRVNDCHEQGRDVGADQEQQNESNFVNGRLKPRVV